MNGQSFDKDFFGRNVSGASNATMNSTDLRSNNSPTTSQGELYGGLNRVPAYSSGENQATAGNGTMYPSNNNLYANNYIGNQSHLNVSTPLFDPAITPAMAMTGTSNSTVMQRGVLMENGTEYLMLPFTGGENCSWYFCNICNLPFNDKKALYYHHYVAHIFNQTIYVCPLCGETFRTNPNLQQHLQQRHPNQCLFCHIEFATPTHLTNHIILCHSNGGYVQPSSFR